MSFSRVMIKNVLPRFYESQFMFIKSPMTNSAAKCSKIMHQLTQHVASKNHM